MTLGILGSGSGSNMQAILDAIASGTLDARVALVLSDNPDAYILERARSHGIESGVIDCHGFRTKFPGDAQRETANRLKAAGVELVCLAGFMRMVKRPLLEAFPGRIINIHPALLPAFGGQGFHGMHVHRAVLARGCTVSGCTVHLVDNEYDHGQILLQKTVPVLADDTADSLAARVFAAECVALPEAIATCGPELAASPSRGSFT